MWLLKIFMRKTDKKLDKQIREVLTLVCETALEEIVGFEWLTHLVNYDRFPASLHIVCIFDTNENLRRHMASENAKLLLVLINTKLNKLSIRLKPIANHVSYDTQENCDAQHSGNWAARLS